MALQTGRRLDGEPEAESVRRTIKRIEIRSVLKFSVLFSVTVALVMLLAGSVLYFLASALGIVGAVQSFIQNAGWPHFRFQLSTVFWVLVFLTTAGAIAWTVITILATFVFNLVSEAVGGVEVAVRE